MRFYGLVNAASVLSLVFSVSALADDLSGEGAVPVCDAVKNTMIYLNEGEIQTGTPVLDQLNAYIMLARRDPSIADLSDVEKDAFFRILRGFVGTIISQSADNRAGAIDDAYGRCVYLLSKASEIVSNREL